VTRSRSSTCWRGRGPWAHRDAVRTLLRLRHRRDTPCCTRDRLAGQCVGPELWPAASDSGAQCGRGHHQRMVAGPARAAERQRRRVRGRVGVETRACRSAHLAAGPDREPALPGRYGIPEPLRETRSKCEVRSLCASLHVDQRKRCNAWWSDVGPPWTPSHQLKRLKHLSVWVRVPPGAPPRVPPGAPGHTAAGTAGDRWNILTPPGVDRMA